MFVLSFKTWEGEIGLKEARAWPQMFEHKTNNYKNVNALCPYVKC